jgi:hypothetical protein
MDELRCNSLRCRKSLTLEVSSVPTIRESEGSRETARRMEGRGRQR